MTILTTFIQIYQKVYFSKFNTFMKIYQNTNKIFHNKFHFNNNIIRYKKIYTHHIILRVKNYPCKYLSKTKYNINSYT